MIDEHRSDVGMLTTAQMAALKRLLQGPVNRGLFSSGWDPWQAGPRSHKVNIRESTANQLISLGMAERWDVDDDWRASTLHITDIGRAALKGPSHD